MNFLLHKKKIIFLVVFLFLIAYGKKIYYFFTDTSAPIIEYRDIAEGSVFNHDISFNVFMHDDYGLAQCNIYCDNKQCLTISCNGKESIIPITIKDPTMSDGNHIITIEGTDSSWNKNSQKVSFNIMIDTVPLEVTVIDKDYGLSVEQGNTLHLILQSNKKHMFGKVMTNNMVLPVVPVKENSLIYESFIPCSTETKPGKYLITCELEDALHNKSVLEFTYVVKEKIFEKQIIKLQGDNKTIFTHNSITNPDSLDEYIEFATKNSPAQKLWKGERFYSPCLFRRISTQFGVLRNSMERGKYRHNGVDLVAKPLSPVWACQDGVIVIKDKFLYTGNTVVIDHGCGILSLYGHLDSFDSECEVGKTVKRGNIIGTIGMTGYATSYHLHWEVIIAGIKVNPLEWINYTEAVASV